MIKKLINAKKLRIWNDDKRAHTAQELDVTRVSVEESSLCVHINIVK